MKAWETDSNPFKVCLDCGTRWERREDFLADPHILLQAYHVSGVELLESLFLFRHDTEDCHSMLAVEAAEFVDLHWEPIFDQRLDGTARCPGYCLDEDSLEPCLEECEAAFVRDILDRVRRWPKHQELIPA